MCSRCSSAPLILMFHFLQVNVTRSGPTNQFGYQWTVTFVSNPGMFPIGSGNMAQLTPGNTLLTGTATVTTVTDGSDPLRGNFTLSFITSGVTTNQVCLRALVCVKVDSPDLHSASPWLLYALQLPYDASAEVVQAALETLPTIGRVEVTRQVK